MQRFWDSVICPVFKAEGIKRIVEIGSDKGFNTKKLLAYVKSCGGVLHAVDPCPSFPGEEWEKESDGYFFMHLTTSLEAIPKLSDADVFLIDGDHNWYTVYHELMSIKEHYKEKFPLVMFHDIGWPYAYRDLYYNPENIPVEYRHPYEKKGIMPGMSPLSVGGINARFMNAVEVGTPRNGVRRAIEDFLEDSTELDLEFYVINVLNGLGMIASAKNNSRAIDVFTSKETHYKVFDLADHESQELQIRYERLKLAKAEETKKVRELGGDLETFLYPDFGSGFSQDTAVKVTRLDPVSGCFYAEFTFEEPPVRVRFDPVDRRYCFVSDVSVNTEKGRLEIASHNGSEVNGGILFETMDPQIIFSNTLKAKTFLVKAEMTAFKNLVELSVARDYAAVKANESKLKAQIVDIEAQCDSLRAQNAELDGLRASLKGAESHIRDIEAQCDTQNAELDKLRASLDGAESHIRDMEAQCGSLRAQNAELEDIKASFADAQEKLSVIEQKSAELSAGLDAVNSEKERQIKENDSLRAKLSKAEREIKSWQSSSEYYQHEADCHFNSYRYRIGTAMVEAFGSPKKLFRLPFTLRHILKEYKSGNQTQPTASAPKLLPASSPDPAGANGSVSNAMPETEKKKEVKPAIRTTNAESSVQVCNDSDPCDIREYRFSGFRERYDLIRSQGVSLIVPVYNAYEETCDCIASVLDNTEFPFKLVLINDCSPDERIRPLLDKYKSDPNVTVYHNEQNLGFVRTVNFGIEHTTGDVVFLNSDTRVTKGWLKKLVIAACHKDNIATATPFSNAAGAFSVPVIGENKDIPEGLSLEEMSRIVENSSKLDYVGVPTGNGFCMYVTRAALDKVGKLDYEAFSRGYGEENDFCMRAKNAGFLNVICDDVYIYHKRSASFKEDKLELIKNNRKILDRRYPTYGQEIRIFSTDNRLVENRSRVLEAINRNEGMLYRRRRVLYVLHEGTGGTPKTNEDLMRFIETQYLDAYLLTSNASDMKLYIMKQGKLHLLRTVKLSCKWDISAFHRDEYEDIYFDVLQNLHIDLVHIRHLFKHSFDIVEVCHKTDIPVILSLHDFYFICPTINLINSDGKYCDAECRECDKKCRIGTPMINVGENVSEWVNTVWRKKVGDLFEKCAALVTTSEYSRRTYLKAYPQTADRFHVIEHGRDFDYDRHFRGTAPEVGKKIKILLAGNIDYNKGEEYILSLIKTDKADKLEFHCIGSATEALRAKIIYHGKYKREEFVSKVEEIKPSYIAIFSIWPETYCHVLSEAWSTGVPCIISDIGTLAERANANGGCILADLDDVRETYNRIVDISNDNVKYAALCEQVQKAHILSVSRMGAEYAMLYGNVFGGNNTLPGVFWIDTEFPKHNSSTHIRVISPIIKNYVLKSRANIIKVGCAEDIAAVSVRSCGCIVLVQRDRISEEDLGKLTELKDQYPDIRIVMEIDDDILGISKDHADYQKYRRSAEKITALSKICDRVITTSEIIAKQFKCKTIIIPNYIDNRLWLTSQASCTPRTVSELEIIYAGTVTHQKDLAVIETAMKLLNERLEPQNKHAALNIIGCTNESRSWYKRIPVPDDSKEYPDYVKWIRTVKRFDIAVAPLDLDVKLNYAKSYLKYLEYASLGVPGVYTDIKPYREVIINGENGFLIEDNSPEKWAEALYRLCVDETLREKIASNALNDVQNNHILEQHFDIIADAVINS